MNYSETKFLKEVVPAPEARVKLRTVELSTWSTAVFLKGVLALSFRDQRLLP